jgi:hypothetical protein
MYLKPTEPHTIGGVLDDAIKLYRSSFANVWVLAFCAEIPISVPRLYFEFAFKGINPNDYQALFAVIQQSGVGLYYFPIMLVFQVFYLAITASIDSVGRGAPLGFGESLGIGLRLLLRSIGMGFCFVVIIVIGTILLVVPGIYLFGALFLAVVAIVVDDAGVFASLGISWRLTQGHWWRTVTIYSVIAILGLIVAAVLGAVIGGTFAGIFGVRSLPSIVANQVLSFAVGVLIMSLTPSALLSIYYDLKLRREGTDLAQRVQALPIR